MRAAAAGLLALTVAAGPAAAQQPAPTPAPTPAAQDRTNPVVTSLTLFAGTAEGLWKSGDWGATWDDVAKTKGGAPVVTLGVTRALLPLGPQVWAGGDGGLFLSDDFGVVWKRLYDGAAVNVLMTSRYPQADLTVFLGTAQGLVRSEDAGTTFRPTAVASPVTRIDWPGPALVLATATGVLISEDGQSFRDRGQGLPEGEVRALAVSSFFAVDPVLFAGGAFGVYRSSDAGRTWKATKFTGKIHDLLWLGPFLYAAGEGGVFRSDDVGETWTRLAEGLGPRTGYRLMFPHAPAAGLEAFVGTEDGLFRTVDGGQHWQRAGLEGKRILALATFPPPPPNTGKRKK
jgi:photosystem II stability/assembly factor-like uncharacterized protein